MDCGAARYRDGEILAQICPRPASRQAYVLSFDILREPPEAFGLRYDPDAGTYVYEAEQKQKKENGEYGNISAKITSVFETGAVKAKANAVLGRFGVRGIKVCEGKSGLFVAMPHTSLQKENTSISFFQWIRKRRKSWPGPCSGPMRKNRRKTPRPRLWPGRNRGESVFLRKDKP